jgi:hypothetical protein
VSDSEFKNVIPLPPGYVSISAAPSPKAPTSEQRRPVIAIAERAPGAYQACVLDEEGRLAWAGAVYPDESQSNTETTSAKYLGSIATSVKTLVTLEQSRSRK